MLLIDNREPESVQALLADDAKIVLLPTGDFLDPASGLLIERKGARDFCASMGDGRLDDQCARLSSIRELPVNLGEYTVKFPIHIPVLLIHGTLWPKDKGNKLITKADGKLTDWGYWSVMMKLVSIQQSGIIVLIVPQQYLAESLAKLRSWAKKPRHRQVRKPIHEPGIWTEPSPQVQLMTFLVGGQQKAKLILDEYGSPGTALAYMHEWASIKGVGPMSVTHTKALLGDVPSIVPI